MNIIVKIESDLIIGKVEKEIAGEHIITLTNPRRIQIVPENKRMKMMLFPMIGQAEEITFQIEKISYYYFCRDEEINKSYLQATSKLTLVGNIN